METEIKIEVADHAPIRARLQSLGATFSGKADEENVYLDRDGELVARGESLRLRKDQQLRLTWKGPTVFHEGVVQRAEIEIAVSSFFDTAQLLGRLGFEPADHLEKRRETWRLPGVEIALDTVAFGKFVEIEGDPAAAQALAHELGLDLKNALSYSYRRLQRQRQALASAMPPVDDDDRGLK
jgi:predicted adenylyl cyclase CyaB